MREILKLVIGILVLVLGFPLGNWLSKLTKEEIKSGQVWFKLIVIVSLIGAVFGLIFRNDSLLFTFVFIAIVTSRSLKSKK